MVWGEVLWDRFPDGDQLGGAPANVAFHLGQAGGWVQLVTRVGDDELGRAAIGALAPFVDTSLVQIDPDRATGEVRVALVDGEPRYTLHAGRAWEAIACTPEAALAISESGVLVFGTLAQRTPQGLAAWRDAIAACGSGVLRVCDVNLRKTAGGYPSIGDDHAALAEAIAAADVLKLNDRELDAIARWRGWTEPVAALRDGRRVLAITHGDAGSTLYGDGAPIEIPGVPAHRMSLALAGPTPVARSARRPHSGHSSLRSEPARTGGDNGGDNGGDSGGDNGGDNVGCGDAYLAILVHGITMGWDLETSGRAASRWAATVASRRGATPVLTEEEIEHALSGGAA